MEKFELECNRISEKYPEYVASYNKVMERTWAHLFNMFIMRKDYFDRYMNFLFDQMLLELR